ncbi:hypothetical protein N7478_008756 [Penicillium angulare]|uniref:uncharacterized protein n=1 Tax=Penicillium angulare TaxID=116970 RepID=UPI0025408DA5|nr:uncharacterized protein N7478_008756 [Penicillium angulare]KAJ5273631.1 hypothetical protein N7478_008756 [Penicillium angulare]
MSLSRSPSPHPGGGWSSPGLAPGSGTSTPRGYSPNTLSPGGISWATAKAKSDEVRKYPSFSTRNGGFFSRQKNKLSARLPSFRNQDGDTGYVDKDSYPFVHLYRRSPLGGGKKVVIILGSNTEGGVMEWKGAREWAIERNSIWNKKRYAQEWGYELEVANMLAKKRYSHEWRESWEKVDVIRAAMRKYPKAEWFWWLDLNTWIMEYSTSLQHHLLNDLESHVYRDINYYNPRNLTHPLPEFYLDELGRSLEGDGNPASLNLLLTQDCGGFNLGSFLIRRSLWTDRLLDTWWDPVMYEQMHMNWEHKEQNALEYLYQSQPWIRGNMGFLPQRAINAFPPGACGDEVNPKIHYQQKDRDLVVNMAGCMFGRDCWAEMYNYRELSNRLNRRWWGSITGAFGEIYERVFPSNDDD